MNSDERFLTADERILKAVLFAAFLIVSIGFALGSILACFVGINKDVWNAVIVSVGLFGSACAGVRCSMALRLEQASQVPDRWYVAHIIVRVKYEEELGIVEVPVWENMVLICAKTDDEAFDKAEKYGKEDVGIDYEFSWGGKAATWEFLGVRKLVRTDLTELADGEEITYNELVFSPSSNLLGFAIGDAANVEFSQVDVFEDEPETKFVLSWFDKYDKNVTMVGETCLDSTNDEIRQAFDLKESDWQDCLIVDKEHVEWLKLKGHEIDLDKYDYFIEMAS